LATFFKNFFKKAKNQVDGLKNNLPKGKKYRPEPPAEGFLPGNCAQG